MAVINRRNRLINFRLSEQELEDLKQVCQCTGARSVSDFARGAVLRLMETSTAPANGHPKRIEHLDQKVSELETRMGLLLQLLDTKGQRPGDPGLWLQQSA